MRPISYSILGIILGLGIVIVSFLFSLYQYDLGLAIFIPSLFFAFSSRRINETATQTHPQIVIKGLFAIFFLLNTIALLQHLLSDPSIRSLEYFLLTTASLIVVFLLTMNQGNKSPLMIIIFSGLMFSVVFYSLYPTISGSDSWKHLSWAATVVDSGGIQDIGNKYMFTPLYHILISSISIVLHVRMFPALFISTIVPFLISCSIIYKISIRNFGDSGAATLSVLFFIFFSTVLVFYLTNASPAVLVMVFWLVILNLFYKPKKTNVTLVALLCLVASILTHQLSTAVVFLSLFLINYSFKAYHYLKNEVDNISYSNKAIAIIGISVITMLSAIPHGSSNFFAKYTVSLIPKDTSSESLVSTDFPQYFQSFDLLSNILYNSSYTIMISLATFSLLFLLCRGKLNNKTFSLALLLVGLFLIINLLALLPMGRNLLPYRWLIFLAVPLSIFAGYGAKLIWANSKGLATIAVFSLLFLSITTPMVNIDSPIYDSDRAVRTMFTNEEVVPILFSENAGIKSITTDGSFRDAFNYYYKSDVSRSTINMDNNNFKGSLILRSAIIDESVTLGRSGLSLSRTGILGEPHYLGYSESSILYDNGNTRILR